MNIVIKNRTINILNHEQREKIKQTQAFKRTNHAFNYHFDNCPARNGYTMKLVRSLCPENADNFTEKYLKWRLENINEDYLLANNLPDFIEQSGCDFETAVIYLIIYLTDNTWEGAYHEAQSVHYMLKYLEEHSSSDCVWSIIKASPEVDSKYAIDYIILLNGKKHAGVQLKPRSFFDSCRQSLKQDIEHNKQAMLRYKKLTGVRVGFWLYEDIKLGKKAIEVK